jgi:hypothetical protein
MIALDGECCTREKRKSMINRTPLVAVAALFALSACQQETIVAGRKDDMAEELAKAPKVVLPPSLKSTKAYRCKDGSLAYVDLFQGDKMANLRATPSGPATKLEAPEAGQPMVAEGYSMTVSGNSISLSQPGKGSQSCKA